MMATAPKTTAAPRKPTGRKAARTLAEAIDNHADAVRELAAAIRAGIGTGDATGRGGSLLSKLAIEPVRKSRPRPLSFDEIFLGMKAVYGKDITWDESVNVFPGGPGAFADSYKLLNERPAFAERNLHLTNGKLSICETFGQVAQLIAYELQH